VKEEAWPRPENAEEVHEALLWMGYVADAEAAPWGPWLDALLMARRVVREADRWFAVEAPRDPKAVLRGRLEALGPIFAEPGSAEEPLLLQLESEGVVLRTRLDGRQAWCDRRLLARIQRYTLDRLRREIEPVTAAQFLRFLSCWQHVDPEHRLDGPAGVAEVIRQLAGFEGPAAAWEGSVPRAGPGLWARVVDQLAPAGEVAAGSGDRPTRRCAVRPSPWCRARARNLDGAGCGTERPAPGSTAGRCSAC
jgi:ATP-dependent Lhr-like helicase